ncbi:MAG TPA: proline dehydrogenase [Cryomorphaceae bacterium]|mgnify:CR=1 FL=1|nr:proline dehydrogenase [Owenweeksia sp.]MBG00066.1 proline dehydrogenase [Owenweeksia sp.]HAD97758.1 proline dehydrogenase [Cryomorphaceae bacterium]|tara:strand:- start:6076 stop:7242 length:1167 start_codon:yes stop_codon:yes gene_type:complete
MVNFDDTATAFITKSNAQLRKAYYMFKMVGNTTLVSLGKRATSLSMALRLPIKGLVKKTVYDQFVGGETMQECEKIIDLLDRYNVKSLLDYSIEGKETEEDFEHTKNCLLDTIRFGGKHKAVPFAVFKVTGMARFALLEKVSNGELLSEKESKEWLKAKERVKEICQAAHDHKLAVLVDAEESWIQPAIDELAEEMIHHYNRERVIVFNTLQMYRVDRLEYLRKLVNLANKENFYLGVKLVRGAYMEKERDRAAKMGYPSPIQPDKAASDRDYDQGVEYVVENLEKGRLVAGSHNEESCRKLANLMVEKGLAKDDHRIWFSQLYGMSDHLSFNLAKAGYNVVKYLPFGPVKETLPYLIRRAEENSSASGQTSRELMLIQKEMRRRGID